MSNLTPPPPQHQPLPPDRRSSGTGVAVIVIGLMVVFAIPLLLAAGAFFFVRNAAVKAERQAVQAIMQAERARQAERRMLLKAQMDPQDLQSTVLWIIRDRARVDQLDDQSQRAAMEKQLKEKLVGNQVEWRMAVERIHSTHLELKSKFAGGELYSQVNPTAWVAVGDVGTGDFASKDQSHPPPKIIIGEGVAEQEAMALREEDIVTISATITAAGMPASSCAGYIELSDIRLVK